MIVAMALGQISSKKQLLADLTAMALRHGYAESVARKFAALYWDRDLAGIGRLNVEHQSKGQISLRQVLHLLQCDYRL